MQTRNWLFKEVGMIILFMAGCGFCAMLATALLSNGSMLVFGIGLLFAFSAMYCFVALITKLARLLL